MKNIFYSSIIVLITIGIFSGCVKKSNQIELFNEKQIVKYEVGNKQKKIDTLVFTSKHKNGKTHQVTFYIDKYPFIKTFDTCDIKGVMRVQEVGYKDDKVVSEKGIPLSCKNSVRIDKNLDKYSGNYSFNFLENMRPLKKDSNYVYPYTRIVRANDFTMRVKEQNMRIVFDNYWSKD